MGGRLDSGKTERGIPSLSGIVVTDNDSIGAEGEAAGCEAAEKGDRHLAEDVSCWCEWVSARSQSPFSTERYPWARLGRIGENWRLYDDRGNPARKGEKGYRISVGGEYAADVAQRAQRRWFTHAFERGGFRVEETYCVDRMRDRLLPLSFVALCLGTSVWLVFRGIRPGVDSDAAWALMPVEHRVLAVVAAAFLLVVCLSFLGVLAYAVTLRFRRPSAVRAILTQRGVAAKLGDGMAVSHRWTDLVGVMCLKETVRLRFRGDRTLWMHGKRPRTHLIAQVAREKFLAEDVARARRRWRGVPLRLGIWTAMGVVVTVLVAYRYPPTDRPGSAGIIIPMAAVALLGLIPLVWLIYGSRFRAWERRWARRNRRRK